MVEEEAWEEEDSVEEGGEVAAEGLEAETAMIQWTTVEEAGVEEAEGVSTGGHSKYLSNPAANHNIHEFWENQVF